MREAREIEVRYKWQHTAEYEEALKAMHDAENAITRHQKMLNEAKPRAAAARLPMVSLGTLEDV